MRDINGYPSRKPPEDREDNRQIIVQNFETDINPATTTTIGGVIVGDNLSVTSDGTLSANKNAYNNIKQIADYLFEVQYSTENIDYTYANEYFKAKPAETTAGACTGIYKDGQVLRHLDWYYNDNVEFIVRRPADTLNGIHASVGVCASVNDLTKEVVESGDYNEKFQLVPFIMTDGINDAGLYIQSNVVPSLDGGFDLNPTAATECCISMAARYILDHCSSFSEVETFFNTVHIYNTSAVGNYGYHFLLAQGTSWEVIEITASGHITVTQGTGTNQMPHGIMTNFRTTGLTFTNDALNWSSVEAYGCGLERYDIATKAFTDSRSFALLQNDLLYTRMYTGATPEWITELCGETDETYGKLSVTDAIDHPEKFTALMTAEASAYAARDRKATNPDTWQTTHSAIYNLSGKSFSISIQERLGTVYEFSLDETAHDLSLYRTAAAQDVIDATKYVKPAAGIPKTDLAAAVQTSLGKADTALQEHQSLTGYATQTWVTEGFASQSSVQSAIENAHTHSNMEVLSDITQSDVDAWGAKYNKPAEGIPATDMTQAVQTSLSKADSALQEHQSLSAYRTSVAQDTIDSTKVNTSDVTDNVTSTYTSKPLSALQGKLLNDRINNLESIGRYLAIWNCNTGKPETEPTTLPYTYKSGDYYRIGATAGYTHSITLNGTDDNGNAVSAQFSFVNDSSESYTQAIQHLIAALSEAGHTGHSGTCPATGSCGSYQLGYVAADGISMLLLQTSTTEAIGMISSDSATITVTDTTSGSAVGYKPNGLTYTGAASTTVITESNVTTGDLWVFDGTNWSLSINHIGAFVEDVRVNQVSVVSEGIASFTVPTKTSELTNDSDFISQGVAEDTYVPKTTTINSKPLSSNITLSAADVGADAAGAAATAVGNLATIAATGNINDLTQTSGDTLILFCGGSN